MFFCTIFAESFDHILSLFGQEAIGDGHLGYGHVSEADGAVALSAGEVYMTAAVKGIVVVAYTVFLFSAAIVDTVQQM